MTRTRENKEKMIRKIKIDMKILIIMLFFLFVIFGNPDKSFVGLVWKGFLHGTFKTPRQWYMGEFFLPSQFAKVSVLLVKVLIIHELLQICIFEIWVFFKTVLGCHCQHVDCIFVETRADLTIAICTWFVVIPCSQICRFNT